MTFLSKINGNNIIKTIIPLIIVLTGFLIIIYKPLVSLGISKLHKEVVLMENTEAYKIWKSSLKSSIGIYLFNVTNPDNIMQGENPRIVECGPYVYDDILVRTVLDVDEENDEIRYNITHSYRFNKDESGNWSENDQVTMINVAYLGTIITVSTRFPAVLDEIGENLIKLFPNNKDIFVKGKVKDILFEGLSLICNVRKFPELAMMCSVLKSQRPPLVRDTGKEGMYKYSLLRKDNGTTQGPFTINRGIKEFSNLGDLTTINGKNKVRHWQTAECNKISGTTTFIWPPVNDRMEHLNFYDSHICRSVEVVYMRDVIMDGLIGWQYKMDEKMWDTENIQCYCPVNLEDEQICLPRGLLDLTKCQEMPVVMSEPHFLHGDQKLLGYAQGLTPNEELHSTFIVIEPITGIMLSWQSRLQLNMKLIKIDTHLLSNISEGYIPIIWFDRGNKLSVSNLASFHQIHRLLNIFAFIERLPILIGILIILMQLFLHHGY